VCTQPAATSSGFAHDVAVSLARFFFPSLCLACGLAEVDGPFQGGICRACWTALPVPADPRCERCDEPLAAEDDQTCGRCLLARPPFASLRASAPYRGVAREILLAFKFRGADYLARHLAARMSERLTRPEDVAEVVAVPAVAAWRRRHDHAAELLARAVATRLDLPFAAGRLEKRRATERQSALPLSRREENVRGVFRARSGAPPAVLLVDDVATSGATARECARRLLRAGARRVDVWCFARAARTDVALEPAAAAAEPRA
jgi:predicted amidophosphoribosyltransferase